VLDNITENLELIEPHQAFFILKNASQSSNSFICCGCPILQVQRRTGSILFNITVKNNMQKYAIAMCPL